MFSNSLAITFHRPLTNGKTKPCLLTTLSTQDEECEVIAKFAYGCEEKTFSLIIEAIANFLACDLTLPIPEAQLVELKAEFVNSVKADSDVKSLISKSVPYAFALKKLPASFSVVTNPLMDLNEEQLQSALEIFVFDLLIKNPDRRTNNPNCLSNGKSFAIFDHDLSLREKIFSFDTDPWQHGYMIGQNYREHIFYKALKGKSQHICIIEFEKNFKKISNERLEEYKNALPHEWLHNNMVKVDNLISFLKSLRDNIDQAINVIRCELV